MSDLHARAQTYAETASRMLGGVLARDDLHLMPDRVSRAAYSRAMQGLRAVEAFVRRMLLMLALAYEHVVQIDMSERPIRAKATTRLTQSKSGLAIFESPRAFPADAASAFENTEGRTAPNPFTLYARTQRLQDLLKDPAARARRLAFVLARRRHGPLLAPNPEISLRRLGTESSSLYDALGARIIEASHARPPPKGPRPRPPPRIRYI